MSFNARRSLIKTLKQLKHKEHNIVFNNSIPIVNLNTIHSMSFSQGMNSNSSHTMLNINHNNEYSVSLSLLHNTVKHYTTLGNTEQDDENLAVEEDLLIPNDDKNMRSIQIPGTDITLQVLRGNLVKEDVDAIVNVTNTHLKMTGGLSTLIIQNGGNAIQRECDRIYKQRDSVNASDVIVTGAGNGKLKCKMIMHSVKPSYHHRDIYDWMVKSFVNILESAEEYNCQSIATTALKESHSTHGFPSVVCANAFYDALINHYVKGGKNKNLKLIRLVESNEDVADIFKNRFDEVFEKNEKKQ